MPEQRPSWLCGKRRGFLGHYSCSVGFWFWISGVVGFQMLLTLSGVTKPAMESRVQSPQKLSQLLRTPCAYGADRRFHCRNKKLQVRDKAAPAVQRLPRHGWHIAFAIYCATCLYALHQTPYCLSPALSTRNPEALNP